MILRWNLISRVYTKFSSCRPISFSSVQLNENRRKNLPSRRLFDELTEKASLDENLSRSGYKPFQAMDENPIIVKKFFISDISKENIEYPDAFTASEFEQWTAINNEITECFSKNIVYDENGFHPSVYKMFKDKGLLGYSIPKSFGGQELSHTQTIFASEVEAQNIAAAFALNAHRMVSAAITEIGTDEQCAEYLPKLAEGVLIGTIAFQEWNDIHKIGLNTRAEYDEEQEKWYLNGVKCFVPNAANSNLFLVLADTQVSDRKGDKIDSLTVFIVDGNLPGVKMHKKDKTIGNTNLYLASVTFDEVVLSKDATLSLPGTANYIQRKMQMNSRLHYGVLNLFQMKTLLNYMISVAQSIEQQTSTENENDISSSLEYAIGKNACSIYALESMLYLTTGIMDKYSNSNIDLETAIFKTHSEDELNNMIMDLMSFVDSRITLSEHPLNQILRNAYHLKFSEPDNQSLKIHIGLEGLQYRTKRLIEEVVEKNNKEFTRKAFFSKAQLKKYALELQPIAKIVFDTIMLLRVGSISFLQIDPRDQPKRQIELQKLSDAVTCVYASYACLLRADRALKLKLPNAHGELAIAHTICDKCYKDVNAHTDYIQDGPVKTFSKYHEFVTHLLLKKEHDFPPHPLTRFF